MDKPSRLRGAAKLLIAAGLAAGFSLATVAPAAAEGRGHHREWRHHHQQHHRGRDHGPSVRFNLGLGPFFAQRSYRAPRYSYAPPPVYYAPPTYYVQPPTYYAPPPTYYAPPSMGLYFRF
jgi:hypothetical protein